MRIAGSALALLLLTAVAQGQGNATDGVNDRRLFHVRLLRGIVPRQELPFPVIVEIDNTRTKLDARLGLSFGTTTGWGKTSRDISLHRGRFRFFMYPILPPQQPSHMLFEARDPSGNLIRKQEIYLPTTRRPNEFGPRDVRIITLVRRRAYKPQLPEFRSSTDEDPFKLLDLKETIAFDGHANTNFQRARRLVDNGKLDEAAPVLVALGDGSSERMRNNVRLLLRKTSRFGREAEAKGEDIVQHLPQWRGVTDVPLLTTADLPDSIRGYALIDAIVWDGTHEVPNAAQRKALALWVKRGGHILLVPALGVAKLKSPLPAMVPNLSLQFTLQTKRVAAAGWPTPDNKLYSTRRFGTGSITYLARPLTAAKEIPLDQLVAAFGLPAPHAVSRHTWFTLQVVATGQRGRSTSDLSDGPPHFPAYRNITQSRLAIAGLEDRLARELRHDVGFRQMDSTPIIILAIAYIICITFVDYFILRRLKRLRFTWISLPIFIAAFSIYSYRTFHQGKLGEASRHEHIIRDRLAESFTEMAYCAIRKPSSKPSTIAISPDSLAWAWVPTAAKRDGSDTAEPRSPTILDLCHTASGPQATIPGIVGSARYFREWRMTKPAPAFTVEELTPRKSSFEAVLKLNRRIEVVELFAWNNSRLTRLRYHTTPARVLIEPSPRMRFFNRADLAKTAITEMAIHDLNAAAQANLCPLPVLTHGPQTSAQRLVATAGNDKWILLATYREPTTEATWASTRLVCDRLLLDIKVPPRDDDDDEEYDYEDDEPIMEGENTW